MDLFRTHTALSDPAVAAGFTVRYCESGEGALSARAIQVAAMRSSLLRAALLLALVSAKASTAQETREPAIVSKCRKAVPNYVDSVAVSAWTEAHRTDGVNVWVDPAMAAVVDLAGRSLRWRITNRLSRWNTPNAPRVRSVVANRGDAQIAFVYGLTSARSELDGTTSRTLSGLYTTGAVVELNTLEASGLRSDIAQDAAVLDRATAAALHEFGHALGIHGHSPSRSDLMFRDGSGENCGAACGPSAADRNTLAYLACRAIENGSGWATN
jgi:hypothetical protein